jgi:hypothetical protein
MNKRRETMKKSLTGIRGFFVRIGWGLYRASVSIKNLGERKRIDLLISLGKAGIRACGQFPAN